MIKSHGYSQIKPQFGNSGDAWKSEGWMVNVDYRKMQTPIRPKDHIEMLRPLLPNKYSPLQENGNGNQGVYLTRVPEDLARQLLELLRPDSELVIMEGIEHQGEVKTDQEAEEDVVERSINKGPLTDTEKETLIRARKGQGQFREDVIKTVSNILNKLAVIFQASSSPRSFLVSVKTGIKAAEIAPSLSILR